MILCCGEALIDMIPQISDGETVLRPISGGAVFNTSIALGRLGTSTGFLSGLSTDMFGVQLTHSLADSHVDASFAIRSDRPTTLAFVQLENGHAKYAFYDENTAGRMITPEEMPVLPDSVSTLFFGGISLAVEPCADTYCALAERESQTRTIMVDPNIRPSFIKDAQSYKARLAKLLRAADIVKVSDEDLEWLVSSGETLESRAQSLIADHDLAIVCVTLGADGAMALTSNGDIVKVPGQKAVVVDTVGAGDTFNAGVLAYLHTHSWIAKDKVRQVPLDVLSAALQQGAATAAITVSRAGANPPWAHELT